MHHDLIKQKVAQAAAILNETGIDCWITFARETELNGDPILDYLVPGNLTWHSALIISSTGGACAIVGKYDRQMVVDTGAFAQVLDYVQGIREPFLAYMNTLNPRSIAINYSVDSEICDGITHGMYLTLMHMLKEVRLDGCVISAEPVISALRQRKSPAELAAIREAIRHTEEIYDATGAAIRPGMTEAHIAAFMREEVARRGLRFAWDPHPAMASTRSHMPRAYHGERIYPLNALESHRFSADQCRRQGTSSAGVGRPTTPAISACSVSGSRPHLSRWRAAAV